MKRLTSKIVFRRVPEVSVAASCSYRHFSSKFDNWICYSQGPFTRLSRPPLPPMCCWRDVTYLDFALRGSIDTCHHSGGLSWRRLREHPTQGPVHYHTTRECHVVNCAARSFCTTACPWPTSWRLSVLNFVYKEDKDDNDDDNNNNNNNKCS